VLGTSRERAERRILKVGVVAIVRRFSYVLARQVKVTEVSPLHDHEIKAFMTEGLGILQQMQAEMHKQTAAIQSIATSLQSDEPTSLVLTLGTPEPQ